MVGTVDRVRATAISLLTAAGLALSAAAASASSLPGLPTELGGPRYQVRPARIDFTGDGTGQLGGFDGTGRRSFGHLHWRFWNRRDAAATGAVWIDDCKPDCAAGRFHAYAVRVFAFRPRRHHFTRLTLRYDYQGGMVIDRRKVVGAGYAFILN